MKLSYASAATSNDMAAVYAATLIAIKMVAS